MKTGWGYGLGLLLVLGGVAGGRGQLQGVTAPGTQGQRNSQQTGMPSAQGGRDVDSAGVKRDMEDKQALARNNDRQRRLVADTDKLLSLATQLHEDVAKTDKNVLSLDVVRRAQEIEKLAHDVKERMKG